MHMWMCCIDPVIAECYLCHTKRKYNIFHFDGSEPLFPFLVTCHFCAQTDVRSRLRECLVYVVIRCLCIRYNRYSVDSNIYHFCSILTCSHKAEKTSQRRCTERGLFTTISFSSVCECEFVCFEACSESFIFPISSCFIDMYHLQISFAHIHEIKNWGGRNKATPEGNRSSS